VALQVVNDVHALQVQSTATENAVTTIGGKMRVKRGQDEGKTRARTTGNGDVAALAVGIGASARETAELGSILRPGASLRT